ncbi:hypothetical protein HPDFL43_00007300 [Hoeflea phototrophica DFL-43]|uniref:Uncharacterized protein n=1 Tax=Hoeflea phototrophica (strain DSM 17068 / NCIMB 14078 / DFL-43) TaxID=411684 RepID=A0A094Z295_HOEPD|nr:hypothetical protein HPDFL43_00007300 [Hoeflea phototrophica DFL-43]
MNAEPKSHGVNVLKPCTFDLRPDGSHLFVAR